MKAFKIVAFLLLTTSGALARPKFVKEFKTQYPSTKRIATCVLCHNLQDMSRNAYGLDFKLKEFNFKAIEQLDSDYDGYINAVEILADRFPGNPTDTPEPQPVPSAAPTATPSSSPQTIEE